MKLFKSLFNLLLVLCAFSRSAGFCMSANAEKPASSPPTTDQVSEGSDWEFLGSFSQQYLPPEDLVQVPSSDDGSKKTSPPAEPASSGPVSTSVSTEFDNTNLAPNLAASMVMVESSPIYADIQADDFFDEAEPAEAPSTSLGGSYYSVTPEDIEDIAQSNIHDDFVEIDGKQVPVDDTTTPYRKLWTQVFKPNQLSVPGSHAVLADIIKLNPHEILDGMHALPLLMTAGTAVSYDQKNQTLTIEDAIQKKSIRTTTGNLINAMHIAAWMHRGHKDMFTQGGIFLFDGAQLINRFKDLNIALARICSHLKTIASGPSLGADCQNLLGGDEHVLMKTLACTPKRSFKGTNYPHAYIRREEHGVGLLSIVPHAWKYLLSVGRKTPLGPMVGLEQDNAEDSRKERVDMNDINSIVEQVRPIITVDELKKLKNVGRHYGTGEANKELTLLIEKYPELKTIQNEWATEITDRLGGDITKRVGREVHLTADMILHSKNVLTATLFATMLRRYHVIHQPHVIDPRNAKWNIPKTLEFPHVGHSHMPERFQQEPSSFVHQGILPAAAVTFWTATKALALHANTRA